MKNNNGGNVSGIIALILGILSVIWAFFLPGGAFVTLIFAIIAIILGRISRKRNGRNAPARVGVILGIIGIVIFVVVLVMVIVSLGVLFGGLLV